MYPFLWSVALLLAGAGVCLGTGRRPVANRCGPLFAAAAGVAGMAAGLAGICGQGWWLDLPWQVPLGACTVAMDGLSAYFVTIICVICTLCALYGGAYMAHAAGSRQIGAAWCCYLLLFGSMLVVVTARNAVLFLVAWEAMSLSSCFLVLFDAHRPRVVSAGWLYLVATHVATACLLVMFLLLAGQATPGGGNAALSAGQAGAVFLLAIIGFGTKAGFFPLHIWLPEAHPAAPTHVSAVMSGVMLTTGIYGVLRVMAVLGDPAAWWGWTLVGIGGVSGVLGVVFALAQDDLKRLLAYSSVEHVGIVTMALGIGTLGWAGGHPTVAAFGFAGGLLHVLNHAVCKSLLFFGAGAVMQGTGSRSMDRLGGLLHRMGMTGASFLIASAAICALPPLNGFVSEVLIYLACLAALATARGSLIGGGVLCMGALALIGGLAAVCFTKAVGATFLGEPRTRAAAEAREAGPGMWVPQLVLAGLCVVRGLCGAAALWRGVPAVGVMVGRGWEPAVVSALAEARPVLWWVGGAGALLVGVSALFWLIRRRVLRDRATTEAVTWDCGYRAPTARMQYSATSFSLPVVTLFRAVVRRRGTLTVPHGLFPATASAQGRVDDLVGRYLFRPLCVGMVRAAERLRWLQHGRNQLYILYIAVITAVLLAWILGAAA